MFKQVRTINSDLDTLSNDVQSLINATATAADKTVIAARKRLDSLFNDGANVIEQIENGAVNGVKRANAVVSKNPIKALGVHPVTVRLEPEVSATLKVWVVKEE